MLYPFGQKTAWRNVVDPFCSGEVQPQNDRHYVYQHFGIDLLSGKAT